MAISFEKNGSFSVLKFGGVAIALILLGITIYIWFILSWAYSSGERVGFMQKFSKKGWICKTWEGEQVLLSPPGTIADKFYFTVRDEEVAKQINQSLGKKIAVEYEQHKGLPTSCFGDTEYFAKAVKVVE